MLEQKAVRTDFLTTQ